MNRWLSSLKERKTDGMPSLRLKMEDTSLDAGQYSNANLRVYRKSAPEDENADDRIWYTYVNDFWNRGSVTLKKGDELIIPVWWQDYGNENESTKQFRITRMRQVTAVEAEDQSITVPASRNTCSQLKIGIRYAGEDSVYYPDDWWNSGSYIYGNGKYQEQIQIHFYDKETGKELDSTPAMGQEKWNSETNKYEYSYEVGTWDYIVSIPTYDEEKRENVEVSSEKKTLTQTSATFTDLKDGDVKAFTLASGQDGYYRITSEAKAAYKFWLKDGNLRGLNGYRYEYDEGRKVFVRGDDSFTLYNNDEYDDEDDEDYYDDETSDEPSDYRTLQLDKDEIVYLTVRDTSYESTVSRGTLCLKKESALTDEEVASAVPLKNGYRSAVSLKRNETRYYSFTPDKDVTGCEPGWYLFRDDYEGSPQVTLYTRYGESWIRERSGVGDTTGQTQLEWNYQEGQQYIIGVAEYDSGEHSNYIYFSRPEQAAEYRINNMPSEMSLLNVPDQMGNVSVTVKMADGRQEEITNWNPEYLYGNYDGNYLSTNYSSAALSATSSLTGQKIYLAAFNDSYRMAYLAKDYYNYSYGRFGEYALHLLTMENGEDEEKLVDLTDPQELTIKAPSADEIPVISPNTGERSVTLAKGKARVYRLDVNSSVQYLLQAKEDNNVNAALYMVNETSTNSYYQMNRRTSRSWRFNYSFKPDNSTAAGTYLVLYTQNTTGQQNIELTTGTNTKAVSSIELKQNWKAPTFIEDLYWYGEDDSVYWTMTRGNGVTVTASYMDEDLPEFIHEMTGDSQSIYDEYDNNLRIAAFRETASGTLELAEDYYDESLEPGTYYAAIRGSNSSLPYPAPGKTGGIGMLAGDVSFIEFKVISKEDAVKGHDFVNGQAALNSEQGYYVGAAYTADADAKVLFTADQPLETMRIYEAGTDSRLDTQQLDNMSFVTELEKGKTYQVFAQPLEAGSITLNCRSLSSIREAIVSSHAAGKTIGTDEEISSDDFMVHAVYENGEEAVFQGTERDLYDNYFVYEITEVKEGDDKPASFMLSGESRSLPEGTYDVKAKQADSEVVSSNAVRITVKKVEGGSQDTIELDEIKTVKAGTTPQFIFVPQEDGLYSILNNGDIENTEFRLVRSGGTSYIGQILPGISRLEAGKKYLVRTWSNTVDQYVSVTKRTPVELTASGLTRTLIATGSQNGYLLVQASEDISCKLEVTASASQSNVRYYTNVYYEDSEEDYDYLGQTRVDGTTYTGYFPIEKDQLYLLTLNGDLGGISSYQVKLSSNSVELTSWKLLAGASTELPSLLRAYYVDAVAKIQETFSDGTSETIPLYRTGKYGHVFYSSWHDEDEDNRTEINLRVTLRGDTQTEQSQIVKFTGDISTFPEIKENTATKAGKNADGVYLYKFIPTQDGTYTTSLNPGSSYYARIYEEDDDPDDYEDWSRSQLRKGETYLVCLIPRDGQAGAAEPSVTVSRRDIKTVKSIRVTKAPNVVLHQDMDLTGMTIEVTYTDNTSANLTYGYSSVSDGKGNTFYADRKIKPDSSGSVYRYRAYAGDIAQAVIDAAVTDVSTLPVIAGSEAAAKSGAATVSYGYSNRWFRFTPSESGTYECRGTMEGISSVDIQSGKVQWSNYASVVFPADSGVRVYSPYQMEAGKTYLIRHYSYANTSNAKFGLYIAKTEAAAVTKYAQNIEYRFEAAEGTTRELPAEVLAKNPAKEFANNTKTVLQNDEPDLSTPKLYEKVEEKNGETVVGYWTFEGYDTEALLATNQNDQETVTVTGKWSFAEAVQKVTYTFESDNTELPLPEEIVSTLLPAEEEWSRGRTVTPTEPAKTEYETIDGVWTFKGYDKSSLTIGNSDQTVKGTWHYADELHSVSYIFKASNAGLTLPAEIDEYKPATQTGVKKGTRVSPVMPLKTEIDDTAGRWVFTGYTNMNPVTVRRSDITFTGYWTYMEEKHVVNYVFVSSDGKAVDQEVLDLLPQPVVQKDVAKGTTVTAKAPSKTEVETEHGVWSFNGYDKDSAVIGNEDVTFTGTWTYAEDKHFVRYEFIADDGEELPAEVSNLLPSAHEEVRGTVVSPKKPIRNSVVVGAETWSFLEYDQESVKIGTTDVKFTGTWTHAEVHTVKYKFVSNTTGASFDDDNNKFAEGETTTEDQILALLPGDDSRHEENLKKGTTKTLTPEAGKTIASKTGVWTFQGYTTNYVKGGTNSYISAFTMESEDVTLTGVWEFDETKVKVSYRYVDEKGVSITDAPAALLGQLPEAVTLTKGDAYTPVEPTQKEVDDEHGVWTFVENDRKGTFRVEDTDIVITATWKYADVYTNVLYQYQSTTGEKVPDEVITAGEKPEDKSVLMGTSVDVSAPAVSSVPTETGNWVFKGWHVADSTDIVEQVTVGKTTVTLIADWEYKPEVHDVKYEFKASATSDLAELTEEVTKLLPEGRKDVLKSSTVPAQMPIEEVKDTTGKWIFEGYKVDGADYDEANPPKMGTKDITFIGYWKHVKEEHTLNYTFIESKSSDVTDEDFETAKAELKAATTTLIAEKTLTKGDAVTPAAFINVETKNGNWTYDGFEGDVPEKVGETDIVIKVKWTYAYEYCPVTYAPYVLENEDGTTTTAPDTFQELMPPDATEVKGRFVTPVDPTKTEIEADGETWHFVGYDCDHADRIMVKGGVIFTGKWNKRKKYQVTYVFRSVTEGKELPADVEALKAELIMDPVFEGDEVQLKDQLSTTTVPVTNGNWTLDRFSQTGKITITDNVTVYVDWSYADEEHKITYSPVSDTAGQQIPEEVKDVMPTEAVVIKGNTATLNAPEKTLVDTADGHWTFTGYTVNGTTYPVETTVEVPIGTEDVNVSAGWKYEEHSYGDWTHVKDATTTAEGSDERTCSVCEHVEKRVIPKLQPANPEGNPNDPTSVAGAERAITSIANDGDPANSSFVKIQAKSSKQTKNSITVNWNSVPGASGYIIYGNMCGGANKFKRIAKVGGTSYTYTGLKPGTYYKFIVSAYKKVGKTEKILVSSKAIHVITKGSKKFTNIKKLKLNKKKIKLKLKKKFKLKATTVLQVKKLKDKKHRKIMFESSNTKVATVNSKGQIKAVGKGTCIIYVYAQNGVFAKAKVTVK